MPGVVAGLGLLSGSQELHRYVADVDGRGRMDDGGRELVLGVLSAVPDLGMETFRSLLVPGSLGNGDLLFEPPVPA